MRAGSSIHPRHSNRQSLPAPEIVSGQVRVAAGRRQLRARDRNTIARLLGTIRISGNRSCFVIGH